MKYYNSAIFGEDSAFSESVKKILQARSLKMFQTRFISPLQLKNEYNSINTNNTHRLSFSQSQSQFANRNNDNNDNKSKTESTEVDEELERKVK